MIEWRKVPGFNDYQVSNDGQIRSNKFNKMRYLNTYKHEGGYSVLTLRQNKISKTTTVHSLVALAFLGTRPDGMQVRHLDGNPANNHVSNLAYGTAFDNAQDRIIHGTASNPQPTYNASTDSEIIRLISKGMHKRDISSLLGPCTRTITTRFKRATGMNILEWRKINASGVRELQSNRGSEIKDRQHGKTAWFKASNIRKKAGNGPTSKDGKSNAR